MRNCLAKINRYRGVLFAALVTIFGLLELGCALLWIEYRSITQSISPLHEIENLSVRVNGASASLLHPIFVHHGDVLQVSRLVKSDEPVDAGLERIWNTGDPKNVIELPVTMQKFGLGVTEMTPDVPVPPQTLFYHIYRYEVIAYDFRHAPKVLNDFSICVVPDNVPLPKGPTPCAQDAVRP